MLANTPITPLGASKCDVEAGASTTLNVSESGGGMHEEDVQDTSRIGHLPVGCAGGRSASILRANVLARVALDNSLSVQAKKIDHNGEKSWFQ
jgi:hypothetical protein